MFIPDWYCVRLLTADYFFRSGMFYTLAYSHFGLVLAVGVLIRICVGAYTFGRMATHLVIMVVYSLPRLHLIL